MDFLNMLNSATKTSGEGYTKVDDLLIGDKYNITGCKLKDTQFGSKISLNLVDKEGNTLWIFLPKRLSKLFPSKNPARKLTENKIDTIIYLGRDKSNFNTAVFEFLTKNDNKENI